MKLLSEKKGLDQLRNRKDRYKAQIAKYEHRAKDCLTCETQGACCLDAHFVNVRISRLEAAAIGEVLNELSQDHRVEIDRRVKRTVDEYGLKEAADNTYACPLFEKGTGCLVHNEGKPLPCVTHACYEGPSDLPPDELQMTEEKWIDDLNRRVYGTTPPWLPLPLAIHRHL